MFNYAYTDSSLNEIDIEMGNIFLQLMEVADPRTIAPESTDPLWDSNRIIQVDELSTEEIFNGYLLSNDKKQIDITYPLLGYKANDIDEVFYGTGNRVRQWEFENPLQGVELKEGEQLLICRGEHKGDYCSFIEDIDGKTCKVNLNGTETVISYTDVRRMGASTVNTFKAKQIQTTYDVGILVEYRKEARYLMDKFILRCADGHIWHPYKSQIAGGTEFHIFTVFDVPTIDRYPKSGDKLKGEGYIYGITFRTHVWAYLVDGPTPEGFIEQINMDLHYEGTETPTNKIRLTGVK